MRVRFVDTTLRDGFQSLWAWGMRSGMMAAVAGDLDAAGFHAIEVPTLGIYFKKLVRELKEDPWQMTRMIAARLPRTVKSVMTGAYIQPFEAPPPRAIVELFHARIAEIGAVDRVQLTSNTFGQIERDLPWVVPFFKGLGLQVVLGLSYTISPRHSDAYYAEKTRQIAAFDPDAIYLKDQGGLLDIDRARTLLPVLVENSGGLPVELHSHCTTGLAPLVYLEALALGVDTLHTAVPPLANGASQPSVFNVAANARLLGHDVDVNEAFLRQASEKLFAIARQEELPTGAPLEYDHAQVIHQVPGGVISNLRHQLSQLGAAGRLPEVLEETVRVRRDMGYPIMITPHSQFVVSQATINVLSGKRYEHVIDELILFAQGVYGEDSGYPWMDQDLKDRLLASVRAKELAALAARPQEEVGMCELRQRLGGPGVSDEELLLRYIMKGEEEIRAMRAAGPPRDYLNGAMPLQRLIAGLQRQERVRYIEIRRGKDALRLHSARG